MDDLFENRFLLKNKRVLITGAGSGIGRETAILLSNLGASTILLDINSSSLKDTNSICKTDSLIITCDLTEVEDIKKIIISAINDSGKLDAIVHSAGMPYIAPLKSISFAKYNSLMKVNTFAALELAKVFSNPKVYSGNNGSIVLISSVYALVGSSANVAYAMSKSALHGITKSLAIELAPKRIRINCVAPGFIHTNMKKDIDRYFDHSHNEIIKKLHPLGLGAPEDVAYSIAFLISDASKWITGSILNVDGGFTSQ